MQREAEPDLRQFLASKGTLATLATTRAMVRTADGKTTLVEIKAVDASLYPLYGTIGTEPAKPLDQSLAFSRDQFGVLVESALLARLNIEPGALLTLGNRTVRLEGLVRSEPDRLAGGLGFGPRLMLSMDALRASGLIQPGSLIRWHYQLKLPQGTDPAPLLAELKQRFPENGFDIRSRSNASPQLERQVGRFAQFLTLIGLTALLVGGVGVANAVAAYLDRKRDDIATFKAVGASGSTVVTIYLAQIAALGLIGIVGGLIIGTALPSLIVWGLGERLPLPIVTGIYWHELLLASAYGALVALAFSLWPLGRAHDVPVAALFRDHVEANRPWPRPIYIVLCFAALGGLAALAVLVAYNQRIALVFLGCSAGIFVALRLTALGMMALARRLPRPRNTVLRLALTNLYRPGAITPSIILSLGLGLTLLVIIGLIDASLTRQLSSTLPEKAPSFFFVDIPNSEATEFDAFLKDKAPDATLERVPMLRGRIVAVKGVDAEKLDVPEESRWALTGDRGITYAASVPAGSKLIQGEWWAADYSGEPLVSLEDRIAKGLNAGIGDLITVNVLGRNITARVANLRQVQWERVGIGFVLVFSPNTFRGAPHSHLATMTFPNGSTAEQEIRLVREVADRFPAISTVRVKDALEAAGGLARQILIAIRGASVVTLLASVLVLAGAIAASHRARLYDAVLLKTLGATRGKVLRAFGLEFLILAVVTAVFAVLVGSAAAYFLTTKIILIGFEFSWISASIVAAISAILTMGLGLAGTWRALSTRPAAILRHL